MRYTHGQQKGISFISILRPTVEFVILFYFFLFIGALNGLRKTCSTITRITTTTTTTRGTRENYNKILYFFFSSFVANRSRATLRAKRICRPNLAPKFIHTFAKADYNKDFSPSVHIRFNGLFSKRKIEKKG